VDRYYRADVVRASVRVRQVDERPCSGFDIRAVASQDAFDLGVLGHARQSVRAQQEQVATHPFEDLHFGLGVSLETQAARDDVAQVMLARFGRGDGPRAHHAGDEGMILGDPPQPSLMQQVSPAVSHVREGELVVAADRHHRRSAHAMQRWVRGGPLAHGCIGAPDSFPEQAGRVHNQGPGGRQLLAQESRNGLGGHAARHLASGVPTHAVGDDQETGIGVREHGVFIGRAHLPGIGHRSGLHVAILSYCDGLCASMIGSPSAMPFPGSYFFKNLVERRSLLFQMVRRDFEKRFIGSAAGWLWGVIHPIVLLLSWTFVFGVCLKMKAPDGIENYSLWLFAGFLPWLLFQDTVTRSSTSLIEQANLITKTVFPSEIVPLSLFLSSLIHHAIALALAVGAVAIWLDHISVMLVFLPIYMLAVGLFAVGIGWMVAALHVYLRDTAQVLAVAITLWFWVTPIFIPEERYPSWAGPLIVANPMAYVVRGYRALLLTNRPPNFHELAIAMAFAVVTFFLGGIFFRYLKRGFADVL
jgi:lipopolysaccharide transport system permease protein